MKHFRSPCLLYITYDLVYNSDPTKDRVYLVSWYQETYNGVAGQLNFWVTKDLAIHFIHTF